MPLFIFSVLIESAYVLYRRYLVLEAKMKSLHRYKEQATLRTPTTGRGSAFPVIPLRFLLCEYALEVSYPRPLLFFCR